MTVEDAVNTGINDNGNLELDDSVVQNNADLGIDTTNHGLDVSGSTISGNGIPSGPAQFNGGIFSEAPLTVANSTISGNNGSSVYVDFGGSAQLQNATIAANPGVGLVLHDTATAVNTIIANNTGGDCSITGSMTSENNNLDSDSTCNFNDPTDQHADPGLGPLANNSGPTPTMALASGSPAVDAGDDSNCPGVDQRGIARPQGPHCDLGAFELEIGAQLSGSFNESIVKPVDLTAAGDSDWALWSYNSSAVPAALTPTETKAGGGRKISDLTIVNGDGTPTRGFGGFADDLVPFNFNWTDGSPDAAVSGGHGGLTAPALGQGLSFTVPAGPAPQELTIWTSAHYANGTLTAHLSDASTPDYTQTIDAEPGEFTNVSENVPAVFTLRYAAASPGQTLTVTWTDDTNNGCPGCDDIVLYGASLDSGLSNLTVNASPSNAGAGIDQVPISTIPNAWLSFFAGSTSSTPVGSTPVGSTPVGSTPVGSTPVGSTPVGSTPVGSTPVGSTPVGSTPVGSTGLFDLPVGSTPVGSTALSSVLLSQVQLHNVTWDQILCGSLLNKPLTAMTVEDLKENTETCADGKTSLQHFEALTMKQVDLTTTLLRTVHWATLLMGNTPLSALPGGFNAWCGTNGQIQQDGGSCTNATGATTVLQMDVAGQLGSAPVGSTPVGSTPVGSTPVGSTPVGSTDVPASLLANISLSDIANLDGDLASVVNCTGSFNCAGKTLGDAYRANAILPTATFSNIQNAMAANGITINDLVVAIIGAAGFPWEQLQIQGLQPYSATKSTVHYTISTNVECSLVTEFTITAHLPKGFFPVDGSAQVAVGNNAPTSAGTPVVLGQGAAAAQKLNSYQWTVDCPNGDTSTETADPHLRLVGRPQSGDVQDRRHRRDRLVVDLHDGRPGHRPPEPRGERSLDSDPDPARHARRRAHRVQRRAGLLQGEARRPPKGLEDLGPPQRAGRRGPRPHDERARRAVVLLDARGLDPGRLDPDRGQRCRLLEQRFGAAAGHARGRPRRLDPRGLHTRRLDPGREHLGQPREWRERGRGDHHGRPERLRDHRRQRLQRRDQQPALRAAGAGDAAAGAAELSGADIPERHAAASLGRFRARSRPPPRRSSSSTSSG